MKDDFSKLFYKYLIGSKFSFPESDKDPGDLLTSQLTKRDSDYTCLLENHVKLTHIRSILKEIHKWLFFWLLIVASILLIVFVYRIFNRILATDDIDVFFESIPLVITSLVSFLSTIVVIPTIIAKFLFNVSEDDNITKLILHTQDHDTAGINLFKGKFVKKDDYNDIKDDKS